MEDPYKPSNVSNSQDPYPQNQTYVVTSQTDGFSITSMVLGILAVITCYFGLILGTAAIIFGHLSLKKIKRKPELKGKGMAIAGLVTGYLSLVITAFLAISFYFAKDSFIEGFKKSYEQQLKAQEELQKQEIEELMEENNLTE